MNVRRRGFLLGSVALAVGRPLAADAMHPGVTVGAIRWDPFYNSHDTAERVNMEASLGPSLWQSRSPACATITNTKTVNFAACGTQAQIDSEIAAANAAKIDYWAYCWYGPASTMMGAWRLHQTSSIAANMNWCLMFSSYSLFVTSVTGSVATYTGYLTQANYQKVRASQPLIYVLRDSTTSSAKLAASIATLRAACVSVGLATPYIILLVGAEPGVVAATGADAIGIYSTAIGDPPAGLYEALVTATEAYWTTMAATGQSMIPTAITGHDRRPRIEHPVPWEVATQRPYVGDGSYYAAGTPAAIAAHIGDMVMWINAHSSSCPSATGLIYSWDEHDEGGSTLNPSVGTGNTILAAVGRAL